MVTLSRRSSHLSSDSDAVGTSEDLSSTLGELRSDQLRQSRRIRLIAAGCLIVVGTLSFFAGRATLQPAEGILDSEAFKPSFVIAQDTVGKTVQKNVELRWQGVRSASVLSTGVVTNAPVPYGTQVDEGDTLFSVNLRPTVAAVGEVPSFRDLGAGSIGKDVTQLQRFLVDMGYIRSNYETGTFDATTQTAVQKWQKAVALDPTGVVLAGDIAYFSALPARVGFSGEVSLGASLGTNTASIITLPNSPNFVLTPGSDTSESFDIGTLVSVKGPAATWDLKIHAEDVDESTGSRVYELATVDGSEPCGSTCDSLVPSATPVQLPATVTLMSATTGPTVPVAALQTNASGKTFIVLQDGQRKFVTVVASDGAKSVVDGVDAGTQIQLLPVGQDNK